MYKILIICDLTTKKIAETCFEHIRSFKKYSKNKIWYFDPTFKYLFKSINFNFFDVVVIHWNILITSDFYFPKKISRAVNKFNGLKILFIQDEYRNIHNLVKKVLKLKINILFSCLHNVTTKSTIYKDLINNNIKVLPTLTGYLPDKKIKKLKPISKRTLDIFYRGRDIPYEMGTIGREKKIICTKTLSYLKKIKSKIKVDIDYKEEKRIYGNNWYEKLKNSKCCLLTESGSCLVDLDGKLWKLLYARNLQKEKIEKVFNKLNNNLDATGISPRVFEAIFYKTAIIAFPGNYSKILKKRNYVELKKDFSNFQSVINKIKDTQFLQNLVDRNFEEFVIKGKFTYKNFINNFDKIVDQNYKNNKTSNYNFLKLYKIFSINFKNFHFFAKYIKTIIYLLKKYFFIKNNYN